MAPCQPQGMSTCFNQSRAQLTKNGTPDGAVLIRSSQGGGFRQQIPKAPDEPYSVEPAGGVLIIGGRCTAAALRAQKYFLLGICLDGSIWVVIVDPTSEFDRWLDRLERDAETNPTARRQLDHIDAQLHLLEELKGEPATETASFRRVRQSRRYPLWRESLIHSIRG